MAGARPWPAPRGFSAASAAAAIEAGSKSSAGSLGAGCSELLQLLRSTTEKGDAQRPRTWLLQEGSAGKPVPLAWAQTHHAIATSLDYQPRSLWGSREDLFAILGASRTHLVSSAPNGPSISSRRPSCPGPGFRVCLGPLRPGFLEAFEIQLGHPIWM